MAFTESARDRGDYRFVWMHSYLDKLCAYGENDVVSFSSFLDNMATSWRIPEILLTVQ